MRIYDYLLLGGISSVYSSPKHKRGDLGIPRSMLPVERESYDSNGRRGPSRRRPHPPEVVTMRSRRKHADTGSVVEKIDSLAKQGQSIYRTLFRKAKVCVMFDMSQCNSCLGNEILSF